LLIMRWIIKWIIRLVALVVVLLVLAIVFKDTIARIAMERRIQRETGMETHIGRVSIALLSPIITIENLKLYNTAEFGGGTFLDVPELHVQYDRPALVNSKFHINLMRLNLAELDIVKNAAGKTNITSFNEVRKKLKSLFPKSKGKSSVDVDFGGIDVLNLSLGKVRLVDLKNPDQNRDININVKNEVVNNIKNEQDLQTAAILLWLRHGGDVGLSITDIMSGFAKKPKKPRAISTNSVKAADPQ
jgi:hypothetical protein